MDVDDDDPPPRLTDRGTSFTFTLTLVLIGVLVMAAWLLKKNATTRTGPILATAPAPADQSAPAHLTADGSPRIPLEDQTGRPRSTYQIITNCRLEDDPANDGDVFKVWHPQGTHRFSLYWVNTIKTTGGSPESAREFADHFGLQTEDGLRSAGAEAAQFTNNLLRNRPFRVATKWEKGPAGHYQAFVYLDDGATGLQNLALLLVQNGLALIRASSHELPEEKISAGDFHNLLLKAEEEARSNGSGAWVNK